MAFNHILGSARIDVDWGKSVAFNHMDPVEVEFEWGRLVAFNHIMGSAEVDVEWGKSVAFNHMCAAEVTFFFAAVLKYGKCYAFNYCKNIYSLKNSGYL